MDTQPTDITPARVEPTSYTSLLLILGAWYLAAVGAGLGGVFSPVDGPLMVSIPIAAVAPVVIFAAVYRASSRLRERVLSLDTRWLVLLHTWRMVGYGFVMMYAVGALPGVFALPAGIGDALAAAWALAVGIGLYGGFRVSRGHLLAWNTFGLVDFVVAISIGVASRWGLLQRISGDLTAEAMGHFPMCVIPTFFVPMYAITHVVIHLQVRNGRALGTTG